MFEQFLIKLGKTKTKANTMANQTNIDYAINKWELQSNSCSCNWYQTMGNSHLQVLGESYELIFPKAEDNPRGVSSK